MLENNKFRQTIFFFCETRREYITLDTGTDNINLLFSYLIVLIRPKKKYVASNEMGKLIVKYLMSRSQWPRGLRRRSSAARLLRLWVRIPPGAWMFVCCKCCVLSGIDLCDGLITRPEESYRLWRVVLCDQETSKTRRLKPATEL